MSTLTFACASRRTDPPDSPVRPRRRGASKASALDLACSPLLHDLPCAGDGRLAPLGVSHAIDVFVTSRCATLRVYSALLTPLRPCRLLSWVRSTWSAFSSSAAPLAPKPIVRGHGALTATPGPLGQFGTQGTGNLTITKWTGCSRIYRCPPRESQGSCQK